MLKITEKKVRSMGKGEKKIKIQGQQSRTWKETLAGKNYPEYPTQRIKL